ncbi:Beta-barrel assembly machine subunit BamE [Aliiruegeria haliotis]|uniref:Beta-barrel assembly machine subunit BamE n=1 Tax=Aliiruegeria haliotis TaxID=1280846 RepID=A0A2T0RZL9_9RHOB|nr:outer membrane protein assembly factor BamE [Aliiruegeria haliotis]PRY26628.1 Beta-barrel assembly machine subunit BamE [Aliiruegeria haliotis]
MGRQSRKAFGRVTRALIVGAALAAATACTPLYDNHGYTPSDADLAQIKVGVDTRESVAETVGSPSASGVLRDSGYYYVSQRVRTYTYQAPEVIERQVVAISFNSRGVVTNIERFGLQDGNVVALSRRVTDSNVQGVGFLRQLMGNVGRFNLGSNL